MIVPAETMTDVAETLLKVNVFVEQIVVKVPPVKVKEVPPLKGPFIGTIELRRPPTMGKMWEIKEKRRRALKKCMYGRKGTM